MYIKLKVQMITDLFNYDFITFLANCCVIWLFRKDYQENCIKNHKLGLINKYDIQHSLEKLRDYPVLITDIFYDLKTAEKFNYVGLYEQGIMIQIGLSKEIYRDNSESKWFEIVKNIEKEKEQGKAIRIGYIPYTSIISFDHGHNEQANYIIFCCRLNCYGNVPYEKIRWCMPSWYIQNIKIKDGCCEKLHCPEIGDDDYFTQPSIKYYCKKYCYKIAIYLVTKVTKLRFIWRSIFRFFG